jgi:zinc resistance-associated protein
MWKPVVAGIAVVTIAGTSLAYAQRSFGGPEGTRNWRPSTEDRRALGEARLAALKAGLALTPEQEGYWPAFEAAARDLAKLRADHMAARRTAPQAGDPAERMRQRATALSETGAALMKLADATDSLYKSLDESQKRRFAFLSRTVARGVDENRRRGLESYGLREREDDDYGVRERRDDDDYGFRERRDDDDYRFRGRRDDYWFRERSGEGPRFRRWSPRSSEDPDMDDTGEERM